ncbi:MAG: HAMP domain-containing sensor histidine kinase [Acidimicrobiales bacterium]
MKAQRKHRQHALRVAGATTLIVLGFYVVAVVVLNEVVTRHLTATADDRLRDRLDDARQQMSAPQGSPAKDDDDTDVDDAPQFLWSITRSGKATALTSTAPPLPQHHWDANPVTLAVGTSNVRFDTLRVRGTLLVAGQSAASISNAQSVLLVAELVFGGILAVVVFGGATVVGLRASAPSELVRRRQAEFTADASHELRTPISVIEAEVGLALDRPREPAEYREVLQRVGRESNRLRRIVEDLLWLARADDETPLADGTSLTDVGTVVEGSVVRLGVLAAAQGVELSFKRVGSGALLVQAQSALIDRLAGVLIDNAVKFAGRGGRVEVSVKDDGTRVDLRVDDSGPGIPESQREAVFDRFHRATMTVTGTGLGLAIADSVVRSTHGEWTIGTADLGGARLEVSWRKSQARKARLTPRDETFDEPKA